ncbi:MAG: glutamate--tRNA ligase [Thermoprotei archaeon]|nr:glutamate--tRNA ligase [Thermoprotei archaeon]
MSGVERIVRGYALRNAVKHGGKARPESVVSMIMSDHPELRPQARAIMEAARSIVEEVNRLTLEEQKRLLESEYSELLEDRVRVERGLTLPPLPGAVEGRVVVRFAPNPDFYIHLGNARPAIVCSEYARIYKGRMILRFEDTDPRTKTPLVEAYEAIREDLRWLGVSWHEEYVQSMRLEIFYSVMREALSRGCAYVDTCGDEGKKLLASGSYCGDRDRSVEWQLERFEDMLRGVYGEGEAVVRVKTDPKHPNPSVRDWVALRIIDTARHPHPLVGSRYIVWPTYNYAVSVDDHLMGVSHVIRGREHEVNTEKQLYVYKCMGWEPPVFIHTGRLKLEGFILSKSKIRDLLSKSPQEFLGYDDPRFGTIAALRRRGILAEAIREAIMGVGIKETDATISWANLASVNRRLLDARADRIMFTANPVEHVYEGECVDAEIPYHPERPQKRTIRVCGGDKIFIDRGDIELKEVRLMGMANVKIENGKATMISRDLDYARKKKLQIIQWVPARGAVKLTIYKPEGLKLHKIKGYAEPALKEYKEDSRLQLVRFGFIRIDKIVEEEYTAILTHE